MYEASAKRKNYPQNFLEKEEKKKKNLSNIWNHFLLLQQEMGLKTQKLSLKNKNYENWKKEFPYRAHRYTEDLCGWWSSPRTHIQIPDKATWARESEKQ